MSWTIQTLYIPTGRIHTVHKNYGIEQDIYGNVNAPATVAD